MVPEMREEEMDSSEETNRYPLLNGLLKTAVKWFSAEEMEKLREELVLYSVDSGAEVLIFVAESADELGLSEIPVSTLRDMVKESYKSIGVAPLWGEK